MSHERRACYTNYAETRTGLEPEVFYYLQVREPGRRWEPLGCTMVTEEGLAEIQERQRTLRIPEGWEIRLIKTTVEVVQ